MIALALGLMSSACSTTDGTYAPDDGRYVSQSFTSTNGAHSLFENTPIRVEIRRAGDEAAEVSWTAECNVMSAETQLRQSRLVVVGDFATTEIGCDERDQAQDDWLTEFFTSEPLWRQDGATLVVRSEDGTTTIELRSTAASEAESDDRGTVLTPTVSPNG